jgi:hypothetical protein
VSTDILVKTASNEINNLTKKMQSFCGEDWMILVTRFPSCIKEHFSICKK